MESTAAAHADGRGAVPLFLHTQQQRSPTMLGKSGGADQVLSLPKGGGALKGLGEKFSPDLYTGTGNFSVPLTVPPGRNGLQPQLALTYSTGNGNGPFGLGWSLSVPGVTLKTSKGLPRYQGKDVYVL